MPQELSLLIRPTLNIDFQLFCAEKVENKKGNCLKLLVNTFFGPKKVFAESFMQFPIFFPTFSVQNSRKSIFRVVLISKLSSQAILDPIFEMSGGQKYKNSCPNDLFFFVDGRNFRVDSKKIGLEAEFARKRVEKCKLQ